MDEVKSDRKPLVYETFGVLTNVDPSILNLNPILKDHGCQIIQLRLDQLEADFSDLFGLKKGSPTTETIQYNSEIKISLEFDQAIHRHHLFGRYLLFQNYGYVVKRLDNFSFAKYDHDTLSNADEANYFEFMVRLVEQLRLFKKGGVSCPGIFKIEREQRSVSTTMSTIVEIWSPPTYYEISKEESEAFGRFFDPVRSYNSLVSLAHSNFMTAYQISHPEAKYITLMTALESLFNQGKDQIAHTISRHLSLIISDTAAEFSTNYARIKKLYHYRSTIVHGDRLKEKLKDLNPELEELVRRAIVYCSEFKGTKRDLFESLNTLGYQL